MFDRLKEHGPFVLIAVATVLFVAALMMRVESSAASTVAVLSAPPTLSPDEKAIAWLTLTKNGTPIEHQEVIFSLTGGKWPTFYTTIGAAKKLAKTNSYSTSTMDDGVAVVSFTPTAGADRVTLSWKCDQAAGSATIPVLKAPVILWPSIQVGVEDETSGYGAGTTALVLHLGDDTLDVDNMSVDWWIDGDAGPSHLQSERTIVLVASEEAFALNYVPVGAWGSEVGMKLHVVVSYRGAAVWEDVLDVKRPEGAR